MKYFNQNFHNISSAHDEVELLLSYISPQAAKIYDVQKMDRELKKILVQLKMEKLADCCKCADYREKCLLILTRHPAVTTALNLKKEPIKKALQNANIIEIREIFIKN